MSFIFCSSASSEWLSMIFPAHEISDARTYDDFSDKLSAADASAIAMIFPGSYHLSSGSSCITSKNSSISYTPDGSNITRS